MRVRRAGTPGRGTGKIGGGKARAAPQNQGRGVSALRGIRGVRDARLAAVGIVDRGNPPAGRGVRRFGNRVLFGRRRVDRDEPARLGDLPARSHFGHFLRLFGADRERFGRPAAEFVARRLHHDRRGGDQKTERQQIDRIEDRGLFRRVEDRHRLRGVPVNPDIVDPETERAARLFGKEDQLAEIRVFRVEFDSVFGANRLDRFVEERRQVFFEGELFPSSGAAVRRAGEKERHGRVGIGTLRFGENDQNAEGNAGPVGADPDGRRSLVEEDRVVDVMAEKGVTRVRKIEDDLFGTLAAVGGFACPLLKRDFDVRLLIERKPADPFLLEGLAPAPFRLFGFGIVETGSVPLEPFSPEGDGEKERNEKPQEGRTPPRAPGGAETRTAGYGGIRLHCSSKDLPW